MNKKNTLLLIAPLVLIALASVFVLTKNKPEKITNKTIYTNTDYNFSISYPKVSRLITEKAEMQTLGYFPTCNSETAVVCIYLPPELYPHSNYTGAGVSINIVPQKTTLESCIALNEYEREIAGNITIGKNNFTSYLAGDAAMSHQSVGIDYRTFVHNTCYEITTRLNTSTFEVYETGSIVKFTDEQKISVQKLLQDIVLSFSLN
jgi:hypothetical protein